MKVSKEALNLAKDLNLSEADAAVMQLKAELYQKAAKCIQKSKLSHGEIAENVGTSEFRITRISVLGESCPSIELLVKISAALVNKLPLKVS